MNMEGLYVKAYSFGESRGVVKSDKLEVIRDALSIIRHSRLELRKYLKRHPSFQYSLSPLNPLKDAPEVAVRMAEASTRAGVGPMAAVAGAIIDEALNGVMKYRPSTAIIENGGEVAVYSQTQLNVMIYAGPRTPIGRRLGFTLRKFPRGVGTSSATVGGGLTFGEADSVTVIAENAALADAAATSICNHVQGSNIPGSIEKGLNKAGDIEGLESVVIIRERHVGLAGKPLNLFLMKN
ncbi:MAG: UPF0280 family protein [Candidatus Bathyarchaeia archaeon]